MHITDEVIECIKVIVNNNQCGTCGSIDGERVRYRCGHCYCGDCVAKLEHCLLCLTPPDLSTLPPLPDCPAVQRATNAAKLLNAVEQAFNVDVYKRSRISEQLKVEKEVFPDCIQAPVKYYNKKKSIIQSSKENEWKCFFPGEKVTIMENSLDYVKHWLDNNEKKTRKQSTKRVFADLNVNCPSTRKRRIPKQEDMVLSKINSENTHKKRHKSGFNSSYTIAKSQTLLDKQFKPIVKKKEFEMIKKGFTTVLNKTEKEESGIFLDLDTIVIDDSQSQVVDKDELAWKAVLEANEKSPYVSQSYLLKSNGNLKNTNDILLNDLEINNKSIENNKKVPFLKLGYLTETCNLCRTSKSVIVAKKNQVAGRPNNVSITIENSTFMTTIKTATIQNKPVFEKHSVLIQTDICNLNKPDNTLSKSVTQNQTDVVISKSGKGFSKNSDSESLFTYEIKGLGDHNSKSYAKQTGNESTQLIIEDSDSDNAANESSLFQVTADVHHSSEIELQVLGPLKQSEIQQRNARLERGCTPNSSNSSDKENFDPNKGKRKHFQKDVKKRKRCI